MDDNERRNALISAISHGESRLSRLDKERHKILAELKSLKAELLKFSKSSSLNITKDTPTSSDGIISKISSPEEKIVLFIHNDISSQQSVIPGMTWNPLFFWIPVFTGMTFSSLINDAVYRSLFRGRVDVYPRLWISKKTGKKGFSPVCNNEWVDGVCEKPKVKCSECSHRTFAPLTDSVIRGHLEGKHTIGVYPLLTDETCRFLAIDFDKESWTSLYSSVIY